MDGQPATATSQLGLLVGYRFDNLDWIAVEYGVTASDSEASPWFDYPVGHIRGQHRPELGNPRAVAPWTFS